MTSTAVTAVLILTVTFVWAFSMIADVLVGSYNPPAGIHAALMAAIGVVARVRLTRGDPDPSG